MFFVYAELWELAVIVLVSFLWDRIRYVYHAVDQYKKGRKITALTTAILTGECLVNESITNLIETTLGNPSLMKTMEDAALLQSNIGSFGSFWDHVHIMNQYFPCAEFIQILTSTYEKFKKSDEVANDLLKKARLYHQKVDMDLALRSYNLALSFATAANIRSHNMANFGLEMRTELMTSDSDLEFDEAPYNDDNIDQYRDEVMFNIDGNKNKRIPSAAECVKIVSDKSKGRHLIVTEVISAGTTLIVEEPYIKVLNYSTNWQTKHCAKCYRSILLCTPCDGCVFVMYCSEECRSQDFKDGHKFECGITPYLHAVRLLPEQHLGLRSICKAGPTTLYKLYMASKDNKCGKSRKLVKGFDPSTGRYDSDSYYQVLYLTSHVDPETIQSLTWMAVSIIKVLDLKTTFFDQVEATARSGFFEFVAVALLRHFTSFQFNTFTLTRLVQNDPTSNGKISQLDKVEVMQIRTGVYSVLNMMNHSCHPTVICKNMKNGKVAVITNRRLIPGDELLFSYGHEFAISPRTMRQTLLFDSHRFHCDCDPCKYNWPILKNLNLPRRLICLECSYLFRQAQIKEIGKCVLNEGSTSGVLICGNCESKFHEKRLLEEIEHFKRVFDNARKLVKDGEVLLAIPMITVSIEFFQSVICPPAREALIAQKFLEVVFGLVVHSWLNRL